MNKYGKLIWAIVGAVVLSLKVVIDDGMQREDWLTVLVAGVMALSTWAAQDTTVSAWMKSLVGGVLAALLAGQLAIVDGIAPGEWVDILIALLAGAGIILDPRRPVHAVTNDLPQRRAAA